MKRYLSTIIFNFLFFLLITIFGMICYNNPRILQGETLNEFSNSFCQNNTYFQSSICKNEYKKKKFILLLLDGTALDALEFFSKPEKHNLTRIYKNFETRLKITGSNFETMFTGKDSRNYFYKPFVSDNLFRQLHNAGYNISFIGDKVPIFKFLNMENNIELNSYKIEIENISLSNICDDSYNIEDEYVTNFLKENSNNIGMLQITREEMYKKLNEYFKNSSFAKLNISECLERKFQISKAGEKFGLIYYTTILDHYNHDYSKKHYKTMSQAYSIDSYLNKIWEFIQENPEFALIIASDHGGNIFVGNGEIYTHGSNVPGNEGVFIIYTKDLNISKFTGNKYEDINRFHYAPSIPLIIEDINIPLESIEMPILFYNDSFWENNVIDMKTFQIIEYFQKAILKLPKFKKKFLKFIDETYQIYREEISFNEKQNKLRIHYSKGIKFVERKLIPFLYYIIFCFIFILYIIKFFIEVLSMKNIMNEKNKTFNKNLFYLMMSSLFFPVIIIFFPFFEMEKRINFVILFSSFTELIPIIKLMKNLKSFSLVIFLINILAIIFFKIEAFYYLKYIFSIYVITKFGEFISFLIINCYIYLYLKKNLLNKYFDSNKKIPMYKFSLYFCFVISFLIYFFHLTKPYYNEGKRCVFLNCIIYLLLLLLLSISMIIPKDEKGYKTKKYILFKVFLILLQLFIIEDAQAFFILIFFIPLLEYLSYIYEKSCKYYRVFIWQFFLFFLEIFYLLTKKSFGHKNQVNVSLREIVSKGRKIDFFLNIHLEANFPLILLPYLFQFTYFPNNKFINSKSLLMRYITYIRGNIISLCFLYNIFIRKVERDFAKLMYYTSLYSFFIIFDGIYMFSFFFGGKIKIFKSIYNRYFGYHKVNLPDNSDIEREVK